MWGWQSDGNREWQLWPMPSIAERTHPMWNAANQQFGQEKSATWLEPVGRVFEVRSPLFWAHMFATAVLLVNIRATIFQWGSYIHDHVYYYHILIIALIAFHTKSYPRSYQSSIRFDSETKRGQHDSQCSPFRDCMLIGYHAAWAWISNKPPWYWTFSVVLSSIPATSNGKMLSNRRKYTPKR